MTVTRLTCTTCNVKLKVPEKLAGKAVKCPKCSTPISVPEIAISEAETPDPIATPVAAASVATTPAPLATSPTPAAASPALAIPDPASTTAAATAGRLCPHCEAHLSATARKCRHCGEFVAAPKAKKKVVVDTTLRPADYALSFLLPPVGLGLGIVSLTRGAGKKSIVMIAISGLMTLGIIGGVIFQVFRSATPLRVASGSSGLTVVTDGASGSLTRPEQVAAEAAADAAAKAAAKARANSDNDGEGPSIVKPPSEEDLDRQPAAIQRAMRANVRLLARGPNGYSVGSGVVIERRSGNAYIITNRHVVDPLYASSRGAEGYKASQLPSPKVMFVTGNEEPGKILWFAPDNVDLAVVRAFCDSDDVEVADCAEDPDVTIGENVFAVGNPLGIGWSLTKGTVSGLRTHETLSGTVPVIQTDTSINPGNSGGGLYNAGGKLVGINDFIIDPRLARSMGFALRYPLFRELYEQQPPE